MKFILSDIKYLFCVFLFLLPQLGYSESSMQKLQTEWKQMKLKMEQLENSINHLNSKTLSQHGQIQTFVSPSMALGGYFENSITSLWGPNTATETLADRHKLGINLSAELGSKFRFVSQFSVGFNFPLRNEHNNPSHGSSLLPTTRTHGSVSFGSLLSQAFGEYNLGGSLRFQFGMGYVPFGRAFQVREPVLFLRYQGPQLIRTASTTEIIIADPFWKGLHLKGKFANNTGFHLYTLSSLDHSGKLGGGARLWQKLGSSFQFGLSGQSAERNNNTYLSYGADLHWNYGIFGLFAEYAVNDSKLGEVTSYYLQPYFKFLNRKLTLHFDFDYMKNILGLTTLGTASVSDPYIKWEYGVGFNYQFLPNVKVRLGFLYHDYTGATAIVANQDRDYYSLSNSWGISF